VLFMHNEGWHDVRARIAVRRSLERGLILQGPAGVRHDGHTPAGRSARAPA
jgi:hypothetical protein